MKVVIFLVKLIGFLIGMSILSLVAVTLAGPLGWPFELFSSWPYLVASIGIVGAIATGICLWPRLGTIIFGGSLLLIALAMGSPGDLTRSKAPPLDPNNNHLVWANMFGQTANWERLSQQTKTMSNPVLATGESERRPQPSSEDGDGTQLVQRGGMFINGCEKNARNFENQIYFRGNLRLRTFALRVECPDYVLYAIHFTNPLASTDARFVRRGDEMTEVAAAIASEKGPVVVVGDFNTAPNALPFSRFMKAANLSHTSCGGRWLPTWRPYGWRTKFDQGNPLTGIPIDHLFTRNVQVVSCTVGQDFGSDHLPLLIELKRKEGSATP
jgi:hypothetical protein